MQIFDDVLTHAEQMQLTSSQDVLSRLLVEKKLTVSVIESLTGGLLSYYLGQLPNSDRFFRGGAVCPHPLSYVQFCGVKTSLFTEKQEIKEHASALVNALYIRMGTPVCIAVSGRFNEDPEPHATMAIGFRVHNVQKIKQIKLFGLLDDIRHRSAQAALAFLKQLLSYKEEV